MFPANEILAMLKDNQTRTMLHPQVSVKHYGSQLLHWVVKNPQALQQHLQSILPIQRLSLVKEKNKDGNSVLHSSASIPASLQIILALYPHEEQLLAIEEKNNSGENLLHLAASSPESLQIILALYPMEKQVVAVQEKNGAGNNLLHLAVPYPESLQTILALYPKEKRLAALQEKNKTGENVLLLALNNPKSLKIVFQSLSEADQLLAIQDKNKYGYNLIQWAFHKHGALLSILHSLPETTRLAVVLQKDKNNRNLLEKAVSDLPKLAALLQSFPEMNHWALADENKQLLFPFNDVNVIQQMLMFYHNIKQLRVYAFKLTTEIENSVSLAEGQKAIHLANKLTNLLKEFIDAKRSSDPARELEALSLFRMNLQQGYEQMGLHRKVWKPILANITIAATGIGLLVIVGKFFITGSVFFAETERQKKISIIADSFTDIESTINSKIP